MNKVSERDIENLSSSQTKKRDQSNLQNVNFTHILIEDSLANSNNIYSLSGVNRKFNNTYNLINDKTSILMEDNISKLARSRKDDDNEFKTHKYDKEGK